MPSEWVAIYEFPTDIRRFKNSGKFLIQGHYFDFGFWSILHRNCQILYVCHIFGGLIIAGKRIGVNFLFWVAIGLIKGSGYQSYKAKFKIEVQQAKQFGYLSFSMVIQSSSEFYGIFFHRIFIKLRFLGKYVE